jgi:predicted CoA-binding protein
MSKPAKDEAELIVEIAWAIIAWAIFGLNCTADNAAKAALAAIRAAGWAVVPVEPTDEMFEAGHEEVLGGSGVIATYRAMLAAAPGVKP